MTLLAELSPALERVRRRLLPITRDQMMLLMAAVNLLFLGIDTYLAHSISGTIRPNEWIPIIFGPVAAVLLLAWRLWQRPGAGRALAAGLALGLLALGRPQALLFLPALVVWLALKRPRPAGLWRVAALCSLAAGAGCLAADQQGGWGAEVGLRVGQLSLGVCQVDGER